MPREPRTFAWNWWFDAPPSRVWPFIADTDRIDRLAGLPAATYAREGGAGREHVLSVRQSFYGVMPVAYAEDPYEWVEGERYSVERRFDAGPVTRMTYSIRLFPDARGTRVAAELCAAPRSRIASWLLPLMARNAKKGFDRAFERIAEDLAGSESARRPSASVTRRVLERLAHAGTAVPHDLATRLASHLASADATELRRVRPYALADRWRRPRRAVLVAFLHAVRAGALELHWESLCPHCRGSEHPAASLRAVRSTNRCEACGIDFDVEFDRSLEAVFRPASDLRAVGPEIYCLGGPGNTPHVVAQRMLEPGAQSVFALTLEPGAHRVRGARREGSAVIHVEDDQSLPTSASIELDAKGARASPASVARGRVEWKVVNSTGEPALVVIERAGWLDDVATALDVVSLEGFRDLLTDEVLAPGERVAVRRIAILFTDLRGSTALYRALGDAAAYALVRDHFRVLREAIVRHDGLLVKTIGDAVMASFRTPADAIAAALDMHRELDGLAGPRLAAPLVLKAGVHAGPSIVVNSGGALDFFGTTSNLAARVQHESLGGDVVVTSDVAADEDVRRVLATIPHREEPFRARLKGFDDEVALHRVVPA